MGLISHGIAFGIGYLVARPEGRRQLVQLREQVREAARRPEVTRMTERGWDLAGAGVRAAKRRAARPTVEVAGVAPSDPAAPAGLVPKLRDRLRRPRPSGGTPVATDDTGVATAAAGTAAAADGVPVSPAPEHPVPPVPPARS
jgi:hypothetical protein